MRLSQAKCHFVFRNYVEAERACRDVQGLAFCINSAELSVDALKGLGLCFLKSGARDLFERCYQEAIFITERIGALADESEARHTYSKVLAKWGRKREAEFQSKKAGELDRCISAAGDDSIPAFQKLLVSFAMAWKLKLRGDLRGARKIWEQIIVTARRRSGRGFVHSSRALCALINHAQGTEEDVRRWRSELAQAVAETGGETPSSLFTECAICRDDLDHPNTRLRVQKRCFHCFCRDCLEKFRAQSDKMCPVCNV